MKTTKTTTPTQTSAMSLRPGSVARGLIALAFTLVAACAVSDPSDPSAPSAPSAPDNDVADTPDLEADTSPSDGADTDLDVDFDTFTPGVCLASDDTLFLHALGCESDFAALASNPIDTSIPGARSVKVVYDRLNPTPLHFQDSVTYPIHHDFASAHLSGHGLPLVPSLASFNMTEYSAPDRRFLLGAVTFYEGANAWVLELAPYDTATPAMVAELFYAIRAHTFIGSALGFHPTSDAVQTMATGLPTDIPIVSTETLYAGVDYQPLNLAVSYGLLTFITAAELETSYVPYRAIVVLDEIPNDISVVSGIITERFQTPLSHINVLSQNRKTPNMALRDARSHPTLTALSGQWVRVEVGANAWSVTAATLEEAELWWEGHRPEPVVLPPPDLAVTDLRDIADVTPEVSGQSLRDALVASVLAFGGKSAHYSILFKTADVPVRPAFGIPAHYFVQFMEQNGLYALLESLESDPEFQSDPAIRDQRLAQFRAEMLRAPLDADFQRALKTKLTLDFPGLTMRFRSSTNSEDLDGFPCAGCYDSHTGDPSNWSSVPLAIKATWASAFKFRTYEERSYYGVAHDSVVMPLLVHHNFPDEAANGVALTANPFDSSGSQPAFYVNVQVGGDNEVVSPWPGTTSDEFVINYTEEGQPVTYLSRSSMVAPGETVLTRAQLDQLSVALEAIHRRFAPAYGPAAGNQGWYAMDVEFKFDAPYPGAEPTLVIKQARPHPGRGQ